MRLDEDTQSTEVITEDAEENAGLIGRATKTATAVWSLCFTNKR